ncbi:helix-turn-helix domain-containing protein [Streptomyces sp. NPDC058374]|uniref:helix-turn-helix domain-containing protein n=1 Tax=Streptomyces sp. NPDC058374 TaxID=3346466 RepID=UPI003651DC8E
MAERTSKKNGGAPAGDGRYVFGERQGMARLVEELERRRKEAKYTFDQLAEMTRFHRGYLHRVHRGQSMGSYEVMAALDKVYGTTHLARVWELSSQGRFEHYFQRFSELEVEAIFRIDYNASVIPGLYQVEGYTRELMQTAEWRSDEEVDELVSHRMRRARLFDREPPVLCRVILDEVALLRAQGDQPSWGEQLDHLVECAERPNVTMQILPLRSRFNFFVGGGFALLELPGGEAVVNKEGAGLGNLIEEPEEVVKERVAYDYLRDTALSPVESLELLRKLKKEYSDGLTADGLVRVAKVKPLRHRVSQLPGSLRRARGRRPRT